MIVRKRGNYFILIKQHDHALIAGEMAAHIDEPFQPLAKTLFAISHHDIGWEELDRSVLWDEKNNCPVSFYDYPLLPKLEAYTRGFPKWLPMIIMPVFYAASIMLLFLPMRPIPPAAGSGSRNWPDKISCVNISRKLKKKISPATSGCCNFLISCRFLCASIKLGENTFPLYKDGIFYQGKRYEWIWEGKDRLRLSPNLFKQSYSIEIPYQMVDSYRRLVGSQTYTLHVMV